jgi:hypothetical protein
MVKGHQACKHVDKIKYVYRLESMEVKSDSYPHPIFLQSKEVLDHEGQCLAYMDFWYLFHTSHACSTGTLIISQSL